MLAALAAGCVVSPPYAGHYQPLPAPRPPVVVVAPPPAPQPQVVLVAGPGRPAHPPPVAPPPVERPRVSVTITTQERQVIREFVTARSEDHSPGKHGHHGKSLPPGLAKRVARGESLPPGWQRKLVRGEVISTEVYRECHSLPEEVVVRLPPPPPGTILVTIDGKVVRLLRATMEILDVFDVHI